ncbi:flagellum-specific ATP synthase FliI, partial [Bacillus cereus]
YFKLGTIQENEENAYIFECKNRVEDINMFLKQGRADRFHFEDVVQAMHHIV